MRGIDGRVSDGNALPLRGGGGRWGQLTGPFVWLLTVTSRPVTPRITMGDRRLPPWTCFIRAKLQAPQGHELRIK